MVVVLNQKTEMSIAASNLNYAKSILGSLNRAYAQSNIRSMTTQKKRVHVPMSKASRGITGPEKLRPGALIALFN